MVVAIDAGRIVVEEFIAHRVPRVLQGETGREPRFSEAVPARNDRNLDFFTRRLKRTIEQRGQPVEPDPTLQAAPVPNELQAYLRGDSDIVSVSQRVAMHLFQTQPGSHYERESLFVTTKLSIAGATGIAVMKLEEEEGVHFRATTVAGKTILDVELYDDLTLTDNTRVFKAGVFWIDRGGLYGLVSDSQVERGEVADFFLRRFLGCRHQRQASLTTKEFYEAVETWIAESPMGDQEKLDAYDALRTEVRSQRTTIDPIQFVADYFAPEHQDALREYLAGSGIPEAEFDKDLARLGTRPSRSRLKTTAGITISGNADDIKERVRSQQLEGEQVIVIRDVLASP